MPIDLANEHKRCFTFYLEKLSVWNVLLGLIFVPKLRLAISENSKIYYVKATFFGEKVVSPFCRRLGINLFFLDFRMLEVKDDNGELVRLRIFRRDLVEFLDAIESSKEYRPLTHENLEHRSIKRFINKGVIDEGIMEEDSVSHMLFIINVIYWHARRQVDQNRFLLIGARPWYDFYEKYCDLLGISIFQIPRNPFSRFRKIDAKNILSKYPFLFCFIKSIRYHGKYVAKKNSLPKLYIEGRGDLVLKNNGYHSDFFWLLNSDFKPQNVLYQYLSLDEKVELEKNDINVSSGYALPKLNSQPKIRLQSGYPSNSLETKFLTTVLNAYKTTKLYWYSFFEQNNVKIYMFWHRFDKYHLAVGDAIRDVGGISVYWPIAFDGHSYSECVTNVDIAFSYSRFAAQLNRQIGCDISYNIITGYCRDYAGNYLREEALRRRDRLIECGAKKIVFVIDENSIDDDRWHTGHELQRENYSYILEQMLITPWLGVIFKPKNAKNLRQRLGPVNQMLVEAEATGRCYVYEDINRYTTSAPPLLAALSADVCIHGHLCAGTAALECALEGLPTLLIDREGAPFNKLHELPKGKVVFDDWPTVINAVMENFALPEGLPGFGDWSSILDELDPFRDGLAAYRMGTYLNWLIEGFERGREREEVMQNAARMYAEAWGEDKVVIQYSGIS